MIIFQILQNIKSQIIKNNFLKCTTKKKQTIYVVKIKAIEYFENIIKKLNIIASKKYLIPIKFSKII